MLRTSVRRQFFALALTMAIGLSFSDTTAQASGITAETRAELQLALHEHISDNTSDSQYRYFDPESGETRSFRLKHLHSEMFRKDEFFLLCADFIDSDNKEVILDYVLRESGNGFRVDQILKGRRSFLMQVFEKIL